MATIFEDALRAAGLVSPAEVQADEIREVMKGLTTTFALREEGVEVVAVDGGREVFVTFPNGRRNETVMGWIAGPGICFDRMDRKRIPRADQVARKVLASLQAQARLVASWGGGVEFLPPGEDGPRELAAQPVPRPRCGGPVVDYGRFAFLRELAPEATMGRISALGKGGKRLYSLFVFRGRRSGRSIGILENQETENAIYAFWAEGRWLEVAQWTRGEIQKKNPPEFIRALHHQPGWQDRLVELLARS